MKLVPKLTLALFGVGCLVMGLNGWLRARREIHFRESMRARDHEMIGRSVSAAVTAIWEQQGRDAALQTINAVSTHFEQLQITWREGGAWHCPEAQNKLTTCVVPGGDGAPLWFTYVPVAVDGVSGAIELSERDVTEQIVLREVLLDVLATALALALLGGGLAFVMGQWLVGRPIGALTDKARRIGQGDFSTPLALARRDELGVLAREINAMCDRLADTLAQLRHADRLANVGRLASGVAHELGTPLNVVSAHATKIESAESTPDEKRASARSILGASEKMTKIIRQLLQFARRTGPQKAPCDLRQLTAEVLELLRSIATKSSVELDLEEGPEDANAAVDAGQYQQVVTNLVVNAIHAMPGGGRVKVRIARERARPPQAADSSGEFLCLSVSDDGPGIAPDDLPHIFEPFFTTKDVGEGTGLGLPVSYGIAQDHGGWITVESEPGRGATFKVRFPRALEDG